MIFKHKIHHLLWLCLLLVSCQNNPSVKDNNNQFKRQIDEGLVLLNSTLEQSNAKGEVLWRLQAEKITYSTDKKTAQLEKLTANLFQGKLLILQMSADKGELRNDGKEIYLQQNIIVLDPRNQAEFKGEEVVWLPEKHTMTMTGENNLEANHTQLVVRAKKAKYNTNNQILELEDDIVATTDAPSLQLKTEHLYWQILQKKVIGNKQVDVIRFDKDVVTDKLKTNQITVDLEEDIATLKGDIEYQSVKPVLQASGSEITWFYQKREMESNQAISLRQPEEGTTITANEGRFFLMENLVTLLGGIYATNSNNKAEIYADNLDWNLDNQQIDAEGNIQYLQSNPELNVLGKTATGNLRTQKILVKGYAQTPVTTTIYTD